MSIPFIQARNFTSTGSAGRGVDLVVIHDMEAPEVPGTALNVAQWFAGPTAPNASAHYCVDDQAVVQCVKDTDVAWHAPGANANGIGIEHAGYARQTSAEWDDPYSRAMLVNSARLAAALCVTHKIPPVWLSPADLLAGKRGITSHANVSAAWRKSNHTDPGPGFPSARYIELVRSFIVGAGDGGAVRPSTGRRFQVGEYVDVCPRPDGGLWGLKEDGGVINVPPGGPFFGSEAERFGKEKVKGARIFPWRGGYVIVSDPPATYHHPDPTWKG